jgi:hypothetical protein
MRHVVPKVGVNHVEYPERMRLQAPCGMYVVAAGMLDRSSEPGVLTGTRDYQPSDKINVTVRLQTTCADNRDGTSIVFATAEREESKLQKMKQTTSAGIGPATITMPAGSAKVLGVIKRETISDPNFYNSFFTLVEGYVVQEQRRPHTDEHPEVARERN